MKTLSCILLFLAFAATASAAGLHGEYNGFAVVRVEVNGEPVQSPVPGINMNGTTLVPLRVVSEALGARVGWQPETYTAVITTANGTADSGAGSEAGEESQLYGEMAALFGKLDRLAGSLESIGQGLNIAREQTASSSDSAMPTKSGRSI